jgi:hypothetical protein
MYLCVENNYPSLERHSAQETSNAFHRRCFTFLHARRFRLCSLVFVPSEHRSTSGFRCSYSDLPVCGMPYSGSAVGNAKAALCRD